METLRQLSDQLGEAIIATLNITDLFDSNSTVSLASSEASRVIGGAALSLPSLHDVVMGFYHAVNWSEPWIQGLMCVHVSLFLLVLFTRRYQTVQIVLWVLTIVLVYLAPYLNVLGREKWPLFSTQDYFDEDGSFLSWMYSFPLLVVSMMTVINMVIESFGLLYKIKRRDYKNRIRAERKDGGQEETGGGGDGERKKTR
eukprot:TRINITY_DN10996_c0_g1_i1.p1 TRINITY_DN10996_c0_g1~~TRINITY_DN10996_c0_g1_i1.p1  ORF type:complete len:199 (-),score=55.17 TRINITY_DN10996_c0_g1_i1:256-852(-)